MNDQNEKIGAQADQESSQQSSTGNTSLPDTSTRRELIERYGKYAVVAAPLLLFASKARAIHSRP